MNRVGELQGRQPSVFTRDCPEKTLRIPLMRTGRSFRSFWLKPTPSAIPTRKINRPIVTLSSSSPQSLDGPVAVGPVADHDNSVTRRVLHVNGHSGRLFHFMDDPSWYRDWPRHAVVIFPLLCPRKSTPPGALTWRRAACVLCRAVVVCHVVPGIS